MAEVNFQKIEKKWQKEWETAGIFEVREDKKKKKYYVLEMFAYPSASGLHMGQGFNYTVADIYARFKRMNGFNVLYPTGYDSLGLPAENAAIKEKINPKEYTERAINNFIKQQKALGLSYDWTRMFVTHHPDYYKWDQWIFLKMLERGIAYKKKAAVNFCSKCYTVLANEQVHEGKCWRHKDTDVEIKYLEQWFFKITDYADELYEGIAKLAGWPEDVKAMQRNWIGKSYGTEINFEIPTNLNFVLLHGYTGNPEANFFPWLKKELESRGYKINAPNLPNTNAPKIMEQVEYVLKNCKFDENTVLLGHSLGSVVALKVLEKLNKPIKKLVLAAGFIEPVKKDRDYNKTLDWKFDFDKIRKNAKEIVILNDTTDKEVPKEQAEKLKARIGGRIAYFEAEDWHITAKEEPEVLDQCLEKWPIFTTRADTIYGVTFMVVSAQHPRLMELVTENQKKNVEEFLKRRKSTNEKNLVELEKEGVFTGSYAINPLTKDRIPVYAGNFVVADYGSGMVMAVPSHDARDFEFSKKYGIPVKVVIHSGDGGLLNGISGTKEAYTKDGILVDSAQFSGLGSAKARQEIAGYLEKKKLGGATVQFKLRDWLISRQRYWGTPIPIIYCDKCGIFPVPEKDLPVKLPEKVKFGKGNPLATSKEFVNVKCPKCKSSARRETDTMDTFVNSSWYFLRYCDTKNRREIFDKAKVKYWMPIDQYIGGKEHACMHLIYFRFYTKFLRDLGLLDFDEPVVKLFNQGMIHGSDGAVMSKSRGNVIDPLDMTKKFGADTLRFYLVSNASTDKDFIWSEESIEGSFKFINKIAKYFEKARIGKSKEILESKFNNAVKRTTMHIEKLEYNLALMEIRQLFDYFTEEENKKVLEGFLKLLHPFCPHITEELWHKLGNKSFISLEKWPKADESKINANLEKQEQEILQTVEDIRNIFRLLKERQGKAAEKIYLYVLPKGLGMYKESKAKMEKSLNVPVEIFSVADKQKYDPENKSGKAKPGKPAIYIE